MVIDFDEKQIIRNKLSRLWRAFLAGREILRHGRIAVKVLERWLGHMTAIFMIAPDGLSCFFHIYKFIAVNRDRRAFLWKSFRQEIRLALGKMWLARANMTFQPVLEGCVGFIFHSLCVDDYLGNTPGGCWADQVERGLEVLSTAGAPRKVKTEKSFCAFFRNCMRGNREWKMKS